MFTPEYWYTMSAKQSIACNKHACNTCNPNYKNNTQSISKFITYICKYQRRPGGMRGAFEPSGSIK